MTCFGTGEMGSTMFCLPLFTADAQGLFPLRLAVQSRAEVEVPTHGDSFIFCLTSQLSQGFKGHFHYSLAVVRHFHGLTASMPNHCSSHR